MKSYGQLWEAIVAEDNIRAAWREFRRHHASKKSVRTFDRKIEVNLERVRTRLVAREWEPMDYEQFMVFEPKPRIISCAPVEDRVVHHAFCRVCTPLMERRFIDQSYACRKERGSHLALKRARELCAENAYFLKLDIHHYFDSVDHGILLGILNKMFREEAVRELVRRIVEKPIPHLVHGGDGRERIETPGFTKGLPIGNLTSQWFANLYLDAFDHYVTEELGLGRRYMRYMDDMLAFFPTKVEAWQAYRKMKRWLKAERNLDVKESATIVAPVTEGIPYLGLRVWENRWRFQASRLRRTRVSMKRHYYLYAAKIEDAKKLDCIERSLEGAAQYFGFKNIYNRVTVRCIDLLTGEAMLSPGPRAIRALKTRTKHQNLGRKVLFYPVQSVDGEIENKIPAAPFPQVRTEEKYSTAKAVEKTDSGEDVASGNNRRNRGGSYNNNSSNCRSGNRNNNNYNNSNANNGFRLASLVNLGDTLHKAKIREQDHPEIPEPAHECGTKMHYGSLGQVSMAKAAAKAPGEANSSVGRERGRL